MNLHILDQQIKRILPIYGISFGNLDDKSTWIVRYIDEPTEEQLLAVGAAIDSFTYDPNYKELTDVEKAIALLLKLSAPQLAEDIALKDELLKKFEIKV